MDPTEAIKGHARAKFEKVAKLIPDAFDIHFIFEVIKDEHKAELSVHSSDGHFFSRHSSENLYMSIDSVIEKLLHQINKEKGKMRNHKS
jgi:putative sigma-54 modulation protein